MSLAPIILFVYNRPWHTEQTLEALARNELANSSILYIYADGPKPQATIEELEKIKSTRLVLNKKQWCKEVNVIIAEVNKGLAQSVIAGTTEILNRYGKVITIEDDVIVSRYYLEFMNNALIRFELENKIWMVSGYNFPVKQFSRKNSSFFLPVATCQAWGTWQRAWNLFDTQAQGYEQLKNSPKLRHQFNHDGGYDHAGLLETQMETDNVSSWAVRFWWSLFIKKGLILFPDRTLIRNIGWDGSGTHSGGTNPYFENDWDDEYKVNIFPTSIRVDKKKYIFLIAYLKELKKGHKINISNRVIGTMSSIKRQLLHFALSKIKR